MPYNQVQMKSTAWVTFFGPVFLLALLIDYQVYAKQTKQKPINRDKSSEEDDLEDVSSEEESEFQFAQKILEQQFIKQNPGTNLLNMFASFFKGQNPFGTGNPSPQATTPRKPRPSTKPTPTPQPNLMESFVQGFLNPNSDGTQPSIKLPTNLKNYNVPSSVSFLPKPSPTKMQSTEEKRIMGIEEAINQALGLEAQVREEVERLQETNPSTTLPSQKSTTDVYQFFFPPITTTTTTQATTTTEQIIEYSTNPSFADIELLLSSLDKRINERERQSAMLKSHKLLTSRKPILLQTLRTIKPPRRRQKPKPTNAPVPELNLNANFPNPSNINPGSVTNLIMSQVRNGNVQMFLLKNLFQFIQSPVETIEAVECSLFQICDFNYFS